MLDLAPSDPHPAAASSLREWSEEEFAASRAVWDELLSSSDADPLFMSWDWQWRWWRHHSRSLGATLRLLGLYSPRDRLIGLAPLYQRDARVRGVLRCRRMELIGNAWRHPHAAFSDYLDIIAHRDSQDAVLETLGSWLRSEGWDDLALCCIRRDGIAARLVPLLQSFASAREVDPQSGWCAPLSGSFEQYIGRLRSDIRRKVFHQRRKLAGVQLQHADEGQIPDFLQSLWRYSSDRWGDAAGNTWNRDFHLDFARCMARSGHLRLSRLVMGDGTVSVMYNVRAGSTLYYLQSGFDAGRSHGLSPGYLHFGYAIQAAYEEGARRFDLLAGSGRHRDYKRDLLTEEVPVVSYHLERRPLYRVMYALYGILAKCRESLHFS